MINAKNITLLRNGRAIAKNFSLEIESGAIQALTGPNGCGKSTALVAIAGDRSLYSGGIFYDELSVQEFSVLELAKKRAVVPQNQKYSLSFTVLDLLKMAVKYSGDDKSIKSAIDALAIETILKRKVTSLSGGEQQRVTIAMALSQATPYLFLDEPFSAQDVESVERITNHLQSLAKKGVGILLVAHRSERDLEWCSSVTRFSEARV